MAGDPRQYAQVHWLGAIVESSEDAIIGKNLDGIVMSWNEGAVRLFGYSAEEAIGMPITNLIPPDRLGEEPNILARIRSGERVHPYETVRRRKDGSVVDVLLTIPPVKDGDGVVIGASKIVRDITERKQALEQQQLLIGEMKHRIRNLLATVQAIASQTLPSISDKDLETFIARLQALAEAQDLLTLKHWDKATLDSVVGRALAPFREKHADRILIRGPADVWLGANNSLLMAMALHELATNAVKHGALSNGTGEVHIGWEYGLEAAKARFLWCERGGPPVKPPDHSGFGSRLIDSALKGAAKLDFRPDGLVCTLEIEVGDGLGHIR